MRSSVVQSSTVGEVERAAQYPTPQPTVRSSDPQYVPPKPSTAAARPHADPVPSEGWLPMLLLAVAVYSVVFSIISAGWVSVYMNLVYSTAVGLLSGLLIAKTQRFPQIILHVAACLAGYWFAIWLTSAIAYHASWLVLLENLRSVLSGGLIPAQMYGSQMVFLFYLTFLCFFLGYFGAWLIYRAHLPWLVAMVYCSIMLVNLQYTKADLSLLVVVLTGALLLLIARMQLSSQLAQWMQDGLHTDRSWLRSITTRFMQASALMTVAILLLSLLLPTINQPSSGFSLWNSIDNAWINLMHGQLSFKGPSSSNQAAMNFFSDTLSITGDVNLPAGEVLYYTSTSSPQSHYLEGFTYDYFDGHTWMALATKQIQAFQADQSLPLSVVGNEKQAKTSITMVNPPGGSRTYIFAPGQPVSFTTPTTIYGAGNGMTSAWTQQGPLRAGEHYQVVSLIPTATPQQLSSVPLPQSDPSAWTSDANYDLLNSFYLQIPGSLSAQVKAMAQQWTRGAANTYAAMNMLVSHFTDQAQFAYSVSNPPVPANMDAVSWLLKTRRGYCTYYATAMTVMARILGIPARVVNGFNAGQFNSKRGVWEVDGVNAHSWVQVYFPGQGWIDFDPTPGFSLNSASNPTPVPTAGNTPTSATPTATGAHPAPVKNPTAANGSGNNGSDKVGASDMVRGMLFLSISLLILLAALLALAVAAYRYKLSKLYANAPIIAGIYWRLSRFASLSGSPPRKSQTPYEYTRMLCQRYPRAQTALWRITHLFVRERWGAPQHHPGAAESKDLEQLSLHARGIMLSSWFLRFRGRRR